MLKEVIRPRTILSPKTIFEAEEDQNIRNGCKKQFLKSGQKKTKRQFTNTEPDIR